MYERILPKGYATPEVPSNFMEFVEGQNYFRALSTAIVGYQWWIENGEGRKPVRVRELEEVPEEFRNSAYNRENARHFWAFTVYNYQAKAIQVLVLKQQTIMRAVEAFAKNPKWGNPQNYDLIVEKVKTGSRERDVEYNVIREPPTPLDPAIAELARNVPVRLEALYKGEDPFATGESQSAGAKADRARRQR